MSIAEEKAAARRRQRAARIARPVAARDAAAQDLVQQVGALVDDVSADASLTITAYLSMASEPSLDAAIADLTERGHRVLIPRVTGSALTWISWHPEAGELPGALGIRELDGPPVEATDLEAIAVLLIPGLAADDHGHRLGQGGGFYDRFLSGLPRHNEGGPLRAIVLFDDEVVAEVPHEAHDERVDVIVTPRRVLRLS